MINFVIFDVGLNLRAILNLLLIMNNSQDPFKIYQKIHFIGIGGIGISALARILQARGHQISGSELTISKNTQFLQAEGMNIKIGHNSENLDPTTELVIHTTAIPANNPELLTAQSKKINILTYPQAVGWLTKNFDTIAVCGTHGKTTTTAMAALALTANSADPTVIVGSLMTEFSNKNERLGESNLFILEACEYQEAFLNYHPKIILLNNIDPEHLDYFQNAENYIKVFQTFLSQLQTGGLLIANADDSNIRELIKHNPTIKTITYGTTPDCDYQINKHQVKHAGKTLELNLFLPGQHNIYNAVAAIVLSDYLQLDQGVSIEAISNFHGANRRFEIKGKIGNTTIVDDYGHAPVEIQATLAGAKEFFGKNSKILCVFQPHQYSRTFFFLNEFSNSFNDAAKVYIPNIYASRDSEEDLKRINVDTLVEAINSNSSNLAENTQNFDQTFQMVKSNYQNYDAVITMGAGDITKLSDQFLNLT